MLDTYVILFHVARMSESIAFLNYRPVLYENNILIVSLCPLFPCCTLLLQSCQLSNLFNRLLNLRRVPYAQPVLPHPVAC